MNVFIWGQYLYAALIITCFYTVSYMWTYENRIAYFNIASASIIAMIWMMSIRMFERHMRFMNDY